MGLRWVLVLATSCALVHCGRSERTFTERQDGGTGGSAGSSSQASGGEGGDGGAVVDQTGGAAGSGGSDTSRCDISEPFGEPTFVPTLSTDSDFDVSVTWDGLTIVVWRADTRLYSATRSSPDGSFGEPAADPLLQVAGDRFRQSQSVDAPTFSGDGLTMYAHFGGQGFNYVWSASRASTTEAFDEPVEVVDLEDVVRTMPYASFDGNLYFMQDGAIHSARKTETGFATPVEHQQLNSPGNQSSPVVGRDELTLYFSTTRSDGGALGGQDIWRATRDTIDDDFDPPEAVVELNTERDERPVWVAPDDCEIFLLRQDEAPATARRVMSARRPR